MSSHGKSKWMVQKLYNFLKSPLNESKNPICIYISYENGKTTVKANFLNLLAKCQKDGDQLISYNPKYCENENCAPFLYPDPTSRHFAAASIAYESLKSGQSLIFMDRIFYEEFHLLASQLRDKQPDRPIIFFLDYIQIVPNRLKSDGWERVKEIAYGMEVLAQEYRLIIVAGSQVNDRRETREGKDIYNSAAIVEDVFNHSAPSLQMNESLKGKYQKPTNGKQIISLTVCKNKELSQFHLEEGFLFDGHVFTERGVGTGRKLNLNETRQKEYEEFESCGKLNG
jgi:replicative DNA helicase